MRGGNLGLRQRVRIIGVRLWGGSAGRRGVPDQRKACFSSLRVPLLLRLHRPSIDSGSPRIQATTDTKGTASGKPPLWRWLPPPAPPLDGLVSASSGLVSPTGDWKGVRGGVSRSRGSSLPLCLAVWAGLINARGTGGARVSSRGRWVTGGRKCRPTGRAPSVPALGPSHVLQEKKYVGLKS